MTTAIDDHGTPPTNPGLIVGLPLTWSEAAPAASARLGMRCSGKYGTTPGPLGAGIEDDLAGAADTCCSMVSR